MPKPKPMTLLKLRRNLGQEVDRVRYGGARITITRHGKPTAALISIRDLELLTELEKARAQKPQQGRSGDQNENGGL